MVDEKRRITTAPSQHKVVVTERETITVDGVSNVESFDDQEVVLETTAGMLMLRGREFHIKQLNLDEGNLTIEGFLAGLEYAEEVGKKARSFLGRLLK
ncbi:MAG: sporulation protein YabP [Firmicutes bacterium]|jgi:sporulation protein YabP|nr:sporulation protein YabP [Bacillota bacterium]MDH7496342.1 sporulation protein YabP [Bacillota bacterium]